MQNTSFGECYSRPVVIAVISKPSIGATGLMTLVKNDLLHLNAGTRACRRGLRALVSRLRTLTLAFMWLQLKKR